MEQNKESEYTNKNGVISIKKLGLLSYANKPKGRLKSVLSLSAQTNSKYLENNNYEIKNDKYWDCIGVIKGQDIKLWAITYLLYVGVLRVSEVLGIRVYDISMSGHVCIKAKKGSNDKVIHMGETMEYMLGCKRKGIEPFEGYDRHYVYRRLKYHGISYSSKTSTRQSVTHAMRHSAIESMREVGMEDSIIQVISGHKTEKNVKGYGNKK